MSADGTPESPGPGPALTSGDARAAWDNAAQAWEAVGQPYPLAAALLRAAEVALSTGDRDEAGRRLRRARLLAEELGARPLSGDITQLARRGRISLTREVEATDDEAAAGMTAPTPVPGEPPLGLTAREYEVLRLVAAGHSSVLAAMAGLRLPIVYNTNCYDSVEVLRLLEGVVDVYLPELQRDVGMRPVPGLDSSE